MILTGGQIDCCSLVNWVILQPFILAHVKIHIRSQIQGFILVFATVVVMVSVVIDLLYAWLDPRIRYG